jgi:TolB protein
MKYKYAIVVLLLLVRPEGLNSAQEEVDIDRDKLAKFIPVALEGYSGEVLLALKFDLEIQGFDVTNVDKAQYLISGNNSSSLVGRVTDRINKASLIAKEYTGGTPRTQAHAFADEIVEKLANPPRKGIARTKIAFKVDTGQNSEIYMADYDGHGAVALTQDNTITRDPAWGPGRGLIFYTSYKAFNPDIFVHDLRGATRRPFARYPGLNAGAAVSPDGQRVAMILSKGGSPDVYVSDVDATNLKQLTRTKEDESSPCWSPDGRTICYASRESGRAALYVIGADGGGKRRLLTDGAINCTEPDWSPDGKTIIFTANMGGFQICTVPAGGGRATPLVAGEDPSWAPNSRTVAFTRRAGGKRVVSLLDVPTKRVKDVRQVSGSCSQPSWAKY